MQPWTRQGQPGTNQGKPETKRGQGYDWTNAYRFAQWPFSSTFLTTYVAHSDPGSMKFSHIIEQAPLEKTVCQNVALTVFHTQNICHHVWKTLRNTLWCFVVLQSWGEVLISKENYGTNLSHNFFPSHDILLAIGDQQCIAMYFWQFSTHSDIYFVCGKLSELHFDA